jgi:hypothetical protein
MPFILSFTFRNKAYGCEFFIDNSPVPCFIFVLLKEKDLINKFGEDISIKTDGENRLARKDDYPELAALRQGLFDAIKTTPTFLLMKAKLKLFEESQKEQKKRDNKNNREPRFTMMIKK